MQATKLKMVALCATTLIRKSLVKNVTTNVRTIIDKYPQSGARINKEKSKKSCKSLAYLENLTYLCNRNLKQQHYGTSSFKS